MGNLENCDDSRNMRHRRIPYSQIPIAGIFSMPIAERETVIQNDYKSPCLTVL